jgi:hypothetical protein
MHTSSAHSEEREYNPPNIWSLNMNQDFDFLKKKRKHIPVQELHSTASHLRS